MAAATSAPDTLDVGLPPVDANTDNSLTVSVWPSGQSAGASDWLIGRWVSNTVAQDLQRNSYVGMTEVYDATTRQIEPLCAAALACDVQE